MNLCKAFQSNMINAFTVYTKYNHESNRPLLHIQTIFTFQWESQWTFYSCIERNSTFASNLQRQEHNILNTIQRENFNIAHERSKIPWFGKPSIQMQPLTRMNKVVIEDYYDMTTMNENVNWTKLTHVLSNFSPNLGAPFCVFIFIVYNW